MSKAETMSNNMLVILYRRSFLDHLYASPVSVRYKLDKKTLVQSTLTSKGIKKDRTNLSDLDVGYLILLDVQNLHGFAIRCTKRGL